MEVILEITSSTSAAAARSSRSPTATRATTCCRASWRCWRPTATRSRSSASAEDRRQAKPRSRSAAEAIADRLAASSSSITRKVGENEALYGSVTNADIADALAAKGFEIDRRKILLADPIKPLGEYDVPVKLHRDVTAQLKVRSSLKAVGAAEAAGARTTQSSGNSRRRPALESWLLTLTRSRQL